MLEAAARMPRLREWDGKTARRAAFDVALVSLMRDCLLRRSGSERAGGQPDNSGVPARRPPGKVRGHSCRVGMAIDLATYNTPLVGVMQSGRWRHLRLELEGMDLVEGAPEDCQGHSGSSFSCQGQRPDRKARKPRNLLRVSYTLYSGLLPLLGCRRLYRGQPAMPRKQLNVTLTPEQYAAVQEAAAEGGEGGHLLLPRGHLHQGDA